MSLPPQIRIELSVDDMRHKVVHALAAKNDEIEKLVNDELTHYIESGRLQNIARHAVQKHMDAAVEEGVRRAFTSWSRNSPTVAKAIETSIRDALWKTEDTP
jgi:hypothetical protein